MKCRGKSCSSYYQDYFYPVCAETTYRINTDAECNLLDNIAKLRDELVRKCMLFEEVFEIDVSDSLSDEVEKIGSD